jgi:hypothetical protein
MFAYMLTEPPHVIARKLRFATLGTAPPDMQREKGPNVGGALQWGYNHIREKEQRTVLYMCLPRIDLGS